MGTYNHVPGAQTVTAAKQPIAVPDPLGSVLKRHLNVNGRTADWPGEILSDLMGHRNPNQEANFRHQLADAILHDTMTPAQYEGLTREDFDTQQDLNAWLREVWRLLYGDRPIKTED
jgi:hypothetical protein